MGKWYYPHFTVEDVYAQRELRPFKATLQSIITGNWRWTWSSFLEGVIWTLTRGLDSGLAGWLATQDSSSMSFHLNGLQFPLCSQRSWDRRLLPLLAWVWLDDLPVVFRFDLHLALLVRRYYGSTIYYIDSFSLLRHLVVCLINCLVERAKTVAFGERSSPGSFTFLPCSTSM